MVRVNPMFISQYFYNKATWGDVDNHLLLTKRLCQQLRANGYSHVKLCETVHLADVTAEFDGIKYGFFVRADELTFSKIVDMDEVRRHEFYNSRHPIVVVRREPRDELRLYANERSVAILEYKTLFSVLKQLREDQLSYKFAPCIPAELAPLPLTSKAKPQKFVVSPKDLSNKPIFLLAAQFAPGWLAAWHRTDQREDVHDLSCYLVPKLTVSGPGILIYGRDIVTSSEFNTLFVRKKFGFNLADTPQFKIDTSQQREIHTSCVVLAGWGANYYSQFLMHTLPRLLLAKYTFPDWRQRSPAVLLEARTPDWLLAFLTNWLDITTDQFEFFNGESGTVRLTEAILPTLTSSDGNYHPFTNRLIDGLVSSLSNDSFHAHERVLFCESDEKFSLNQRACSNWDELAEVARSDFGFHVFHANHQNILEQIKLAIGASALVAQANTSIFNAIFSKKGTTVGAIGKPSRDLSYVGTLRQHKNAYLEVEEIGDECRIDAALFRSFLNKTLELESTTHA